jgi:hypothetical protein
MYIYAPVNQTVPTTSDAPRAVTERAPFVPSLVVVAAFLPEAFGFFVGDFRLTPVRLALLLATPIVLFQSRSPSKNHRRPISDLLVPLTSLWSIVAITHVVGLGTGLKSGGVSALEFWMPYAVMRYLLRDKGQVHRVVRLFCIVAGITGLLGLLDTFASYYVLRDGLARLTGYSFYGGSHPVDLSVNYRLGLLRAMGPLDGPELFGTAMCYALLLSGQVGGRARWFCRFGSGVGLLVSLSSGPWLAAIIGLALFAYRGVVRFRGRWLALIVAGTIAFVMFYVVVARPFAWLINHGTLDASTGYFRMMIWEYGGASVMQSPIFGLGIPLEWARPSWMPSSVDSLWLRTAMVVGIPGSVLEGLTLLSVSASRLMGSAEGIGRREKELAETLAIIMFLTVFIGFTVDYFGTSIIIVSFLAGLRSFLGHLS